MTAEAWWRTSIIDIRPGEIRIRGYAIEELIGRVSFPAMIWLMARGGLPAPAQAALLEAALVAAVDHGPHAPSIAVARMTATCGVPLNVAVASGINALGDVHGGAGEQCMALYAEVASAADFDAAARESVERRLAAGRLIEGFGHRFHPVDPRSVRLKALVADAARAGTVSGRFLAVAEAVERALAALKGRPLPMNVDGALAMVLSELGFSPPWGKGLFVLSRAVGILAHAREQQEQGGRIKGPMPPDVRFLYEGPPPRPLPDLARRAP